MNINMRVLTTIILTCILVLSANSQCIKLDIIVLGDYSGSAFTERLNIEKVLVSIVEKSTEDVRVGVMLFNTHTYEVFPFSDNTYFKEKIITAKSVIERSGGTNIAQALLNADSALSHSENQKMIILISDGDPGVASRKEDLQTAHLIKSKGVMIYSIFVKPASDQWSCRSHMREIAFEDLFMEVENYGELLYWIESLNFCL